MRMESARNFKIAMLLGAFTLLCHWSAYRVGAAYMNSDFSVYYLFSDHVGTSNPFFYFQSNYGGTLLGHLRALFASIISPFLNNQEFPRFEANQIFTFLFLPSLLSIVTYFSALRFATRSGAIFAALIVGAGIQYWIHRMGSDFYWIIVFFGLGGLALRTRYENPCVEMDKKKLFLFSIAAGLALYSSKLNFVFVICFFFPITKKFNRKELVPRLGLVLAGLSLGLVPDLFFRSSSPNTLETTYSLQSFSAILDTLMHRIPLAIRELCTGYPHLLVHKGGEKYFSYALFFFGFLATLRNLRKRPPFIAPLLGSAALTILYCALFRTYDVAPSRYLFPLLPFFAISLALAWDSARQKEKWILLVVAVGHLSFHLQDRYQSYFHYAPTKDSLTDAVRVFRQVDGLKVVLSDDYWASNTYTALSQGQPFFVSTGTRFGPEEGFLLSDTETKVGLLLSHPLSVSSVQRGGRDCAVSPLGKGEKYYYLANCGRSD